MKTRLAALALVMAFAVVGYALLLHRSTTVDFPGERRFGQAVADQGDLQVYVEPLSINAVADSMQVRVTASFGKSADDSQPSRPDRDFSLVMGHDDTIERVELHAHQAAPATTIELDLNDGDVKDYPLDAYRVGLWIRGLAPPDAPEAKRVSLPMSVTVWERVLGFRLRASEQPAGAAGGVKLSIDIRRSFSIAFFVLAAYGAMVVLACGALTIGTLTFLGVRKPEATMMGALAGVVFALPTLRNALPGGAPLGVTADTYVFLWAELAAVLAIGLLIATWARFGPRP